MAARQDGDYWLNLRHRGEQGGAGIVNWDPGAQQRWRGKSPTIQALELVTERSVLTPEQRSLITEKKFPVSKLQRFVEDRDVRKAT